MPLKHTPATYEGEHLVVLPAGLTGTVTTDDGTVYDLGPAGETVLSVESHDHAKEVALAASDLAADTLPDVAHDAAVSSKNLKKKG